MMILIDANYDMDDVATRFWRMLDRIRLGTQVTDKSGVSWLYIGYWVKGRKLVYLLVAGAVCGPDTKVEEDAEAVCLAVGTDDRAVIVVEREHLGDERYERTVSLRLPRGGEPVLYG
ncbi:MAG: hypothetical protein KF754_01680 [Planctomycetes bacterium]|nr:hypothetical protein [Planctomycetota bacterium]